MNSRWSRPPSLSGTNDERLHLLLVPAGAGVGLCSSVIPYVADQLAMRRLARATYALMVSLLPATATVIGVIVLSQLPSLTEVTGVALVMAGVAAHQSGA